MRDPYHFHDIHTTILHQLGLDQEQLTYLHLGRKERLTSVLGKVIRQTWGPLAVAVAGWHFLTRQP